MKKLGKIELRTQNLLKPNELMILRGGYVGWSCKVFLDEVEVRTEYGLPGDTCEEAATNYATYLNYYYNPGIWRVECC